MLSRRLLSSVDPTMDDDEGESLLGGRGDSERMELRGMGQMGHHNNRAGLRKKGKVDDEPNDSDQDWEARRNRPRDYYISVPVNSGDTLQTLALKYNVPLAELKRINNLIKESELFARSKLKIPVKPGSVLTEAASIHGFGGASGSDEWQVETLISPLGSGTGNASEVSSPLLSDGSELGEAPPVLGKYSLELNGAPPNDISSSQPPSKQAKRVKKILRNMDKDLQLIRQGNGILVERSSSGSIASSSNGLPLPSTASSARSASIAFPTSSADSTSATSSRTKSILLCIGIIAIAVILILAFSRYETAATKLPSKSIKSSRS